MEETTFAKWYEANKESLRDEYRTVKASMKLDGAMDIPTLRQWAKEQYEFSENY